MSIRRIRAYVELVRQGDGTARRRPALLDAHRTGVLLQLEGLQDALTTIDRRIATDRNKESA
jgi:hypothetical protein